MEPICKEKFTNDLIPLNTVILDSMHSNFLIDFFYCQISKLTMGLNISKGVKSLYEPANFYTNIA